MGDPLTTENSGSIGARELFAERFALLYVEAGDPPLKRVTESVARARRVDERGQLVRIPAQRVSDWRRGRNVPARFAALAAVLEVLIGEARKAKPQPVADGLYDLRAWRALWERAQAGAAADGPPAVCPYLGLAAFGPEEARWFFGRERATAALIERVAAARRTGGIVMLVGASGAGKSSLLSAGLVPALAAEGRPVVVGTPGPNPLKELAVPAADGDGLVVVVDQFEEIFTLCESESERRAYVQALQAICTPPAPGVVVLGLRADFYGRCLDHPELVPALQDRQLVLGPMTEAELRDAVTRPAKAVGLRLEEGLVELLLSDLGAGGAPDAGALPLLSHALLATWQRRQAGRLTVAGYRAAGGIQGAVAATAERAWASLGQAGQDVAQAMLLGLVRVGEDGQDSRRRSTRADLLARAGEQPAGEDVLEVLAGARLLTLDADAVEITHEALLRAWPRLHGWIDQDRAGMLTRQRVEEDAQAWDTEGRDNSLLYRGARLETGLQSATDSGEVSSVAREFLAVSTRYRRRTAWVRRAVVAIIAVFALLAATTATIAIRQRDDARFGQVLAEADRLQETDPSLAAQLYLVAHQLRPDDKDVYTRLLSTQHSPLATPLIGHTGSVYLTSFSPDGRILATASYDNTARLWDVHDRTHPVPLGQPLTGHKSWLSSAVFSPDGQVLATAGDDHTVRLWDVRDPAHARPIGEPLTGNDGTIYLLAFSPDGRVLATANENHTARLWDVRDPAHAAPLGQPLTGATAAVRSLAFSPNGNLLAVSGDDHIVRLWNVVDPAHPAQLSAPINGHENTVHSLAFSPDSRVLASGSEDGNIKLWNVVDPGHPDPLGQPLSGHHASVWSVVFSADGRMLASGGMDRTARLWNVTDPSHVKEIGPPLASANDGVFAVGFSPDGASLAVGGDDSIVRLWSIPSSLVIGSGGVRSAVVSDDGRLLATAGDDDNIRLWALGGGAPTPIGQPLAGHTSFLSSLAFSHDGRLLLSGSGDKTVRLWNVADPAHAALIAEPLRLSTRYTAPIAVSPDNRLLATGDDDLSVRLWNLADPAHPVAFGGSLTGHTGYINSVAFNPSGSILATASSDLTVRLWDVSDPARPVLVGAPLAGHSGPVRWAVFSPDGRVLATASNDKTVRLWDVHDPAHPAALGAPLAGHSDAVVSAAFGPGGRTLISTGADKTIRMWDLPAGTPIGQPLTTHTETVSFVVPGPKFFFTGGDDSLIRVWDLALNHIIDRICATTRGVLTPQQWQQHLPPLSFAPPCG
jgi:WD40 repeat protein